MMDPISPHFLRRIPKDTTCLGGGVLVLEAVTATTPELALSWHKDGEAIKTSDRHLLQLDGRGRCRLLIKDVGAQDEGEYECRARNPHGQASCFGEVYVYDAESEVWPRDTGQMFPAEEEAEEEKGESKSGLFILIDEGSQDEDDFDEHGRRESLSASEQIESIIEDLTMGDGSLSLSLGKDGTFHVEREKNEDCRLFKTKGLDHIPEDLYGNFEDDSPESVEYPRKRLPCLEDIQKFRSAAKHDDANPVESWKMHQEVGLEKGRRNTTCGGEVEERNSLLLTKKRSSSDGREPSPKNLPSHLVDQQNAPWDSLHKLWNDSSVTESLEEYMPSELEFRNDEVFASIVENASSHDEEKRFIALQRSSRSPIQERRVPQKIAADRKIDITKNLTSHHRDSYGQHMMESPVPHDSPIEMSSFSHSVKSFSYSRSSAGYQEESLEVKQISSRGISHQYSHGRSAIRHSEDYDTDDSKFDTVPEQYVAIADYSPDGSDPEMVSLSEGQIVEVLEAKNKFRWLIKTKPTTLLASRQGWVPASYLEKKTARTAIRSIEEALDSDGEDVLDVRERDALKRRRAIVRELVETEEEFVKDMQHVVNTYFLEMDNPRMPKELRDQKDVLFMNFKSICDFHNNVLIKGVQYYSAEPRKLGKTFLRLERDFDMHANYCRDEPQAQALLATSQVKEYFQEYSRRIGEVDKSLCDHLKLPIQRINDYQLLLKELIKYSARLKEDCIDLQKALDLMLSIPQRANDLKYINCIEGYRGNFHKLGRLLRHDWLTVTDPSGRPKERYLFLFKSHIFATKVLKLSENKSKFILKDIIRLSDVKIQEKPDNSCQFELHHTKSDNTKFPLTLQAKTEVIKEAWLKDIRETVTDIVTLLSSAEDQIAIMDKPKVEVLENFDAYEEMNTVMTESIRSGSLTSIDEFVSLASSLSEESSDYITANEPDDGTCKLRFRKTIKATSCVSGDTASLECEILAVPPATVSWLKDNVPLNDSDRIQFVAKDNKRYLVIRETLPLDTGLYTCKAENGLATSACSAQLTVHTHMEEMKLDDKPSSPVQKAPEFVIKFHDTELLEGTSVRLLLKVRAYPEPVIKFFKNGVPIKEDDRIKIIAEDKETYEIVISHVRHEDEGVYTCIAKNSVGEETISSRVVVSAEKQDVFHGIHSVENGVPKKGLLKGGEDPKFTWFRDGHDFEASDRFKVMFKDEEDTLALVFQHVKPEDAGLYTCVASTTSGRISCSAELTVEGSVNQLQREPAKPDIKMHIVDTEVSEGGSAMLELKVAGYPRPKLTWTKDGEEIKSGGRFRFIYEDEESVALIIKSAAKDDAGTYNVVANNELGKATTKGQLLVRAAPKFKKQMHDMSIMTDEPVKFEVEVEGKPTPEIIWYKDGQVVKETERIKMMQEKEEVFALVIKKVIPEDAGSYSCVASNTSGKISEFGNLTVKVPPYFSKDLKNVECKEGESIKLDVKVEGNPTPTVKWLKDGSNIKDIGKRITIESDDKSHSVTIKKTELTDYGVYSCEISSELGIKSTSSNVTVNAAPKLSQRLSDITVKEGDENVRLEVKAEGYPEPKIHWFIDKMEITETSNKYKLHKAGDLYVLVIKRIDEECAGTYTLKASNDVGEAESSAVLTVLTKPKFVKTLSDVETNEGEDVTLTVQVAGNPEPKIQWYKDKEDVHASATIKITKEEGNTHTLYLKTVTGESAGDYECRATNSEGKAVSVSAVVVKKITKIEKVEEEATEGIVIEPTQVDEFVEANIKRNRYEDEDTTSEFWDSKTIVKEHETFESEQEHDVDHKMEEQENETGDNECDRSNIIDTILEDSMQDIWPSDLAGRVKIKEKRTYEKYEMVQNEFGYSHHEKRAYSYAVSHGELHQAFQHDTQLMESFSHVSSRQHIDSNWNETLTTNVKDIEHQGSDRDAKVEDKDVFIEDKMRRNVILKEVDEELCLDGAKTAEDDIALSSISPTIHDNEDGNDAGNDGEHDNDNEKEAEDIWGHLDEDIARCNFQEVSSKPKVLEGENESERADNINAFLLKAKPQFTENLKDVEVWLEEEAVFEVKITGMPEPNVTWYKDGQLLEDGGKISIVSSDNVHRLIVSGTRPEDASAYKCTISNIMGEASQEAKLSVKTSTDTQVPTVLKKLDSIVANVKQNIHFEAKIYGTPEPDVIWFKDDKQLKESERTKIIVSDLKHVYSLDINGITSEDEGIYSAKATNIHGETSTEAKLVVHVPPSITLIKDKKAFPASTVNVETTITGKPEPIVKWYFGQNELRSGPKIKITADETSFTYSVVLENIEAEQSGEYSCVAMNSAGKANQAFNITVTTEAPRFIKGLPASSAAKIGCPIKLEVQVYGLPMPQVKWYKDENEISASFNVKLDQADDRNFSLTIEKLSDEDVGNYTCKAYNKAGEAVSHCKVATKFEAPKFLKSLPREVCIIAGEPFALEAKLDNNPMPAIKWLKDGKEVLPSDAVKIYSDPDGTVKLSVDSATPEDRGKYTIVASNEAGDQSSASQVSVQAIPKQPSFLQKLQATDVTQGSPIKLLAKITGHPKPNIKWLKDGKPLRLDPRITLIQDPDGTVGLQISDAKPEDAGKYTLALSNTLGDASSDADVGIKSPDATPDFLQALKPVQVIEGFPCKFEAKVGGQPLPEIKWLKDGVQLVPDGDRIRTVDKPDGSIALILQKALPEDAGTYSCIATNPKGEAKSDADLGVTDRAAPGEATKSPGFVTPLSDIVVDEGKPAKLVAEIEGNPFPDVKWTKDDEPVKPSDNVSINFDDKKISLDFKNISPNDAGKYECVLTNPEGETSSAAKLKVNKVSTGPVFIQKISDQTAVAGGEPRFLCKVSGFPKPEISWYFNDKPLQESDKHKIKRDGDLCALQVRSAKPEDRGKYTCKAKNNDGEATCSANLEVTEIGDKREKSEPPSFLKKLGDCSVMEGMSAKFTACITGFPEPDFKWFKDGKEVEASDRIQIQVEPHGLLRLVIKNVTPEDVGNYTLKISNAHGNAESTSKLQLEILEERRPRKPVTPIIDDISKNIFSPVPLEDSDKDSKKYPFNDIDENAKRPKELDDTKIQRPKIDDDDAERRNKKPVLDNGEKIKKPAFDDGSDRRIKKPAVDDDGERLIKKPALDEYVVYEKPKRTGIPFALPDKPIISRMNDRGLTLSWKPSIPDGPSVPVNYIVDMLEYPDGDWFVARSGIRGCCCEIRNLVPFRDYKFRIRVENKYGISDPSPFAHALRTKLERTPPRRLPHLPPEFDFRPDTSPFFPKDYDIDRPIHDQYAHPPRFLRQQDDTQYGVKGEPASIHWWIYGYPMPSITFYFNDEKIEMHGRYDCNIPRNASECTLFINRMMDRDVGVYECVAINEHGEARQRVKLAIAEFPVFTSPLEEKTIMIHKSGKLECRVVGVPYPDIKWYKDWHPIASSNRIQIEWKEPDHCILTISNAIAKDSGLYSCTARNIAGMASSSAMIFTEEDEADYAYLTYEKNRVIKARTKPMESIYDIGDELGRGTQSTVYHAVERSTGNSYAAKIMHGKDNARPWMNHELDIMNELHDRHLIRAVDAYETKNSLSLVTELAAGGELLSNICKHNHLTESEVAHYIRQLLWGLDHMHSKGIAHLGLTPSDILISKPGGDDIKICDFGLSSHISINKDTFLHYGMPEFVAPEIVNKHPVSLSTDMWSIGVITYLLLSGISPFLGSNDAETLLKVQKGHLNFDAEVFSAISNEAKDFISQLLVHDRSGRMDVKAALSHPWLKSADRQGYGTKLSTDRLRNYYHRYSDWVGNAACHRFYRRRSLESAFTHPSRMVYPPGERYTPPSSPEISPSVRTKPPSWDTPKFSDKVNREHEHLDYELGYVDSTSQYQQGPDTYLLQLRDVDFPLRLRQYMRVSAQSSPSMAVRLQDTMLGKNVTVRERRRFTDIMDEEIDDECKGETGSVRRRLRSEMSPRSATKNRLKELFPSRREGQTPFFREKLQDVAIVEGQPEKLACFVIGDPEPNVTWYRNDVMMTETNRVKIVKDSKGRSMLDFQPAKAFDVGIYKVVARNDAGETICRARMKLGDVPGRPDAPEVSEVSDTEALVRWNPPKSDGNSNVVCYSLDFKKAEEGTWKEIANNIDHLFMLVRGLDCGSKYHFRIRAMNRFGWGEHSSPSAETLLVQGSPKIRISRAMKHQQERTEDGKTFDLTAKRPSVDYSVEDNPIAMNDAAPTDKYRFIAEIARGQFSLVVKCCNHRTGQFYAAKLLEFTNATEESVRMEYEILKSLRHERIPSLVDAYRYENLYVLIMEKLQGYSVLTYLTHRHEYNEDLVARIITQVLDALEYLHHRNIVYLNIQPDNIVMTTFSSGQVKLVDFGNAKFLNNCSSVKANINGPAEYLAPEVLQGEELFPQSDIWGIGVLTYILLSGVSPFLGESEAETIENASFVRYRFEHLYKEITMEATKFLLLIFKRTPTKRPTAEECLDNKWLNPSDYMLKKRERAVFLSSRLKPFADEYHRRQEEVSTTSETLLNAFSGSQMSRSVSIECDSMTTF